QRESGRAAPHLHRPNVGPWREFSLGGNASRSFRPLPARAACAAPSPSLPFPLLGGAVPFPELESLPNRIAAWRTTGFFPRAATSSDSSRNAVHPLPIGETCRRAGRRDREDCRAESVRLSRRISLQRLPAENAAQDLHVLLGHEAQQDLRQRKGQRTSCD